MKINSIPELKTFAQDFIQNLEVKKDGATVIALSGDLGAGKTTFAQQVAEVLGIQGEVTSPTFVIMNKYNVESEELGVKGWKQLIHVDAYRLDGADDIKRLGFEEELKNPESLIIIEWPEKIAEILPETAMRLNFKWIDEHVREVGILT